MVNCTKSKRTVERLREKLDDYITARERSEQQNAVDTLKHNNHRGYQNSEMRVKWNSNVPTKTMSKNSVGHIGSASPCSICTTTSNAAETLRSV